MTNQPPPSPLFALIGVAVQREITPREMEDYLTPVLVSILEAGVQVGCAQTLAERQRLSFAAAYRITEAIDQLGTVIHALGLRALGADEAGV